MASSRPIRAARITLISFLALTLAMAGVLGGLVKYRDASWLPRLGLDLAGGTQIVLTPRVTSGATVSAEQVAQARDIIVQRVDAQGVAGAEVTTQGENNIVVSMPGTPDRRTEEAIRASSQMQFRPVFAIGNGTPPPATTNNGGSGSTSGSSSSSSSPSKSASPSSSSSKSSSNKAVTPSALTAADPKNPLDPQWITPQLTKQFEALDCTDTKALDKIVDDPAKPLVACSDDGTTKYMLGPVAVRGDQIADATAGYQVNQTGQTTNTVEIQLTFNGDATKQYGDLSKKMVQLPDANNPANLATPQPLNALATVLDSKVLIAPGFNEAITTGQASITGGFSFSQAQDLAQSLKFGALPISFDLESRQSISPTLGSEQLRWGIIAGIIGLLLVIGYAILQYHALAIVTIGSVVLAFVQTFLLIAILGHTNNYRLDMAGVTGLIVAIGVTADSFIVYFERIRDELREGRTLRSAVEAAWARAKRTILVADGVNFIAAIVLYFLASSGVRGFAFTLGLTTLLDIIVVFAFSHPLVTLLARFKFFSEGRRFSGLERGDDTPSVRYVGAGQVAVRTSATGGEGSSL
ncbi:protein translocase subunit SecD [Kribbia dieselivorans]|uniref:protein translocase subunit SecD n=1 Tax=Kribbia dieselivorans TaxID=331526 RepID=UPI000837EA29|nr:protein translocase subunit SecD [Kribbia dieselivorans]